MYSAEVIDHFQNPRNAGEFDAPDATARRENPVCGDILELSIKVETTKLKTKPENIQSENDKLESKRIVDIRFRAKGCVPTMACGSAITELIKGKSIEEARKTSREDLIRKIGGLPTASEHASHLALDTLAALLRTL